MTFTVYIYIFFLESQELSLFVSDIHENTCPDTTKILKGNTLFCSSVLQLTHTEIKDISKINKNQKEHETHKSDGCKNNGAAKPFHSTAS